MRTSAAGTWRAAGGPARPPAWPVAILPVVLAAVQIAGTIGAADEQPDREPLDAVAFVLLLAGPTALLARRRRPVAVLAVTLVAALVYMALGYPYGPVFASLAIALFIAVSAGHRVAVWLVAAAGYVAYLILGFLVDSGERPTLAHATGVAAWLAVVLILAEVVRARRERAAEGARALEENARRRASEERLRIARELHDVLAHNISLINVQAGVALHLLEERPEQARTALAAIKEASKDALREMRSVLDVLRQVDEDAPRAPAAPGLARLGSLVAGAEAAGLTVLRQVEGTPRDLPAEVDLAAFRIVQEALTNVARHAGATEATVRVAYREADLTVQVDDNGRGAWTGDSAGAGSGIAGMRDRAAALGGDFDAGPRPDGGFRVRARLPLKGPP